MAGAVLDVMMRRPYLALIAALVLETVVFLLGQADIVASDPLWYASVANDIAFAPSKVFDTADTHPFVMRVGLTAPIALFYRLFGVSTVATNLVCLLSALGVLVIVYAAAPTPRAKLVGMALAVCCAPLLRNATSLNVDLPAATLMAASVLCLARRDRPRGTWWVIGAAAFLFAAFLVKETAVWCCLVWLYALAVDLRASDARTLARRFAPGIGVGIALGAGYLAVCAHVWGSPFARFAGIEGLAHQHTWALFGQPTSAWVDRLTWQVPLLAATLFQALVIPGLASPWLVRGRDRIWPVATLMFLLLYWFGSTSLSEYGPLPISKRMILPVLPVLLVTAMLATDAAIERLRGTRWLVPVAAAFALAVAVPGARAAYGIVRRATPETDAFALLRAEAAVLETAPDGPRQLVIVCGEPRCQYVGGFYFGFAVPPNVTLVFADDFARAPLPEHATVRALVHLYRARGERTTGNDRTSPIEMLKLPALVQHRTVRLYDAGDGRALWQALQT